MARVASPARLLSVDGRRTDLVVETADTIRSRSLGLLGRREVPRALLLRPCRSVHSLGMRVDLEVAYLDDDLTVVDVSDLPRWRVHLPRWRAHAVLEAGAGALSARGVRPGAQLALEDERA